MPQIWGDKVGTTHGSLTVICRAEVRVVSAGKSKTSNWLCVCHCGQFSTRTSRQLSEGRLRGHQACLACSGRRRSVAADWSLTYVQWRRLYRCWYDMRQRCSSPTRKEWEHYGGRGIRVCARWNRSFRAFVEDMGPRPTNEHTIDRIDVNGNYERTNCKWSTRAEQNANRRVSRREPQKGEVACTH